MIPWHDRRVTLATRILGALAVVSAAFAGVVGAFGSYLLATAADDTVGLNAVLGRAAVAAGLFYGVLAVAVLVLVRLRARTGR